MLVSNLTLRYRTAHTLYSGYSAPVSVRLICCCCSVDCRGPDSVSPILWRAKLTGAVPSRVAVRLRFPSELAERWRPRTTEYPVIINSGISFEQTFSIHLCTSPCLIAVSKNSPGFMSLTCWMLAAVSWLLSCCSLKIEEDRIFVSMPLMRRVLVRLQMLLTSCTSWIQVEALIVAAWNSGSQKFPEGFHTLETSRPRQTSLGVSSLDKTKWTSFAGIVLVGKVGYAAIVE